MHDQDSGPDRITETSARLALAIGRLNRRMLRATEGLSQGTLSALATVVKYGPLRLNELAQYEGIAAATITRVIADLEARGYVAREVDVSDRRAFAIEATAQGVEFIASARSARADVIGDLLRTIDAADLDLLDAALPLLEDMAVHSLQPMPVRAR